MSKREDELRKYLTEEECKAIDDYEKKLKAIRDKVVKKEKAEIFWQAGVRETRLLISCAPFVESWLIKCKERPQAMRPFLLLILFIFQSGRTG